MRSPLTSSIRDRPAVPVVLVLVTLGFTLIINLYGLIHGISIVVPHLFYIPVILAAFFYPRRGIAFAAVVSAIYLLMVAFVHPGYNPDILSAAVRCSVFLIIAAVVSYLSEQVFIRDAELTRAKEDWERTFDAVPDLIALIDRDHRIIRVNRAMAESLGISKQQAVGMRCFDVVHHASHPPLHCPHAMLLRDGREHIGEIHEDRLGGDFLVTASPLRDAEGTVIGSVHSARDITQRRQIERALRQSEETLRQKSQTLALRNRELNCLYEIARLVENTDSTDALLSGVAKILPSAWPYPDSTCARVVLGSREFRSAAFNESSCVMDSRIIVHGREAGKVEILFPDVDDDKRQCPEGETDLLSAITERLGRVLERKEMEEALRESEEKYRTLVESSFDGIAIHQNGILVYINRTAAHLLGAEDPGIFIGRPAIDLVAPAFRSQVMERIKTAPGMVHELIREQFLCLDGATIDVDVTTTPSVWEGRPAAYVTFRDITKQIRTEKALRQKTEELDQYFTASLDLFCIADTEGYFRRLNPEWEKTLGYPLAELEGRRFLDFVHPDDLPGTLVAVADLVDQKSVINFTNRYRHKDGSYRWIEWRSFPKGDLIFAAARDITRRKEAEDALRESEERYRAIIENIQDVFFRIDAGNRVDMVSPSAVKIFGYDSEEEMLGMPAVRLWKYPELRSRFIDTLIREGGVVRDWEAEFAKKDGTPFWVSISARMRTDSKGGYAGSEGILRDISERKKMEEALRSALRKLNMLSSITRHDILNQITGLRTFLELSYEDLKGTPHEEFIKKEDQAAEAIQRQIEFTKFYQDIGVNAPKWQDVRSVIHQAIAQLDLSVIEAEITVPAVEIFADPLIVKVFFNLMENSLRHGERVTKIGFSGSESGRGYTITYRDNGVGVSAEDKPKLFRKGFGKHTGLGLYLSQEILAITGIIITENGVPGEGVQFEMTVPFGSFRSIPGPAP